MPFIEATGNGPTASADIKPNNDGSLVVISADTWGGATVATLELSKDGVHWGPARESAANVAVSANWSGFVPKEELRVRLNVADYSGSAGLGLSY